MKNFSRAAAALLILILCLTFCACGAKVKADISEYEKEQITIAGVADEEISITAGELADMECVKENVTTQSRGKEITVTAIGPDLETILNEYGYDIDNIKSLTVVGKDGYTMNFDSDFFVLHPDMIFSLCDGSDPLYEDERPARLVIPGVMAEQWVKGIDTIYFELAPEQVNGI